MKKQGGGKIINIGSMMSIFGTSFAPAYAASKGGIVQLTKATASRVGPRQHPGQRGAARLDRHRAHHRTRAARCHGLHDRVLARTPAGRWGVPDDISGIAVFLGGPASDFVTGTAIPVDGGYSIQG